MKPYPFLLAVSVLTGCYHSRADIRPPAAPATPDPPARVARISYLRGAVSNRMAGVEDWAEAELNRPLTSGDSVWAASGGRAELQMGNAAVRLDSGTSVSLLDIGTNTAQLKLTQGTLSLHVRELDENEEFEIDTPDAAISVLRAGEYRVEVSDTGPGSVIIARGGMTEVTAPGVSFVLRQRQQARVPGADGPQSYTVTEARAADSFDAFCAERGRREEQALAAKRVSPRMIGYEDLDDYGEWSVHVSYGPVWRPRGLPPGWAPYRFGHWVWIEPWGWTWIEDAPWGFAPFHYGRWIFVDGHWIWIPGPYHRYPVYAPALVVFVGGGGPGMRVHFRVGIGIGVAWFPLGPREVWFPPYRASRVYVTNVNITHTVIRDPARIHHTDIARQHYVNRHVENAVTAVPEDVFRRARPVHREAVRVSPREAASSSIGGSAPPLAPTRESLSAGERRTAAAPAPSREHRPVIVNRPPPKAPVPFEQRRPALDQSVGRAPDPGRIEDLRRDSPSRSPDYRQEPRRQPAEAKPARPTETAPAARRQSDPDGRRDRQWEQRTAREEAQRQTRIEKERQQQQKPSGRTQGGEPPRRQR